MRLVLAFIWHHLRFILLVVLIAAIGTFPCNAQDAGFKEIVAFGDSLSDMGNRWVQNAKDDSKWKKTWVVMLTSPKMLNISDLRPSGMVSFYGGSNYAVGGAGTEYTSQFTKERNKEEHLTKQVSGRYLNPEFNTFGVKKDALHVVCIGTNDIVASLISPVQIATGWAKLDEVGIAVAKSVESQIDALAKAGVRHVLWSNLNDTSKIPSVRKRVSFMGEGENVILKSLHNAALAYNKEMDRSIIRLEQAHPGFKIIKLDFYNIFEEMGREPLKYGLDDTSTGADDARHLFSADGLHPTPKGHQLLADYAWSVLKRELSPAGTAVPSGN